MKKINLIRCLVYIGILSLVVFGWQAMEFVEIGKIQGSYNDSIIAVILTWSLYLNIDRYIDLYMED